MSPAFCEGNDMPTSTSSTANAAFGSASSVIQIMMAQMVAYLQANPAVVQQLQQELQAQKTS
jgi:hypothetical protein